MRYFKFKSVVPSVLLMLLLISTMCAADVAIDTDNNFGYFNGGKVFYLLTDVSSSALNAEFSGNPFVFAYFGINTSPRLNNAIAPGVTPPVLYYVTNNDQPLIFGAQWPSNTYMPIWKIIKVKWNVAQNQRITLKSGLDVAKQGSKVTLTTTGQVAAASILINTAGAKIPQAQTGFFNGDLWIVLPTFTQYYDGGTVTALYLDFGYQSEASLFGANYAPAMNQLNAIRNQLDKYKNQIYPDAWRKLYARFVNMPNQWPITPTVPGDNGYSPIVNEWQLTARGPVVPLPIDDVDDIPGIWLKTPTNFMGNEPIIGP